MAWPIAASAQKPAPSHEIWTGATISEPSWMVFSGASTAPFGDLNSDGLRLRAQGGTGTYSFRGHRKFRSRKRETSQPLAYKDDITFLDALAGYHIQWRHVTAKIFAGLAYLEHDIDGPADFTPEMSGGDFGPKVQIELWYDAGDGMWSSLNASYTTILDSFNVNSRIGLRLSPEWSAGVEMTLDHRVPEDTPVAGAELAGAYASRGGFVRYAWDSGELSLSGGLTLDIDQDDTIVIDESTTAYVSVNWLTKF